MIISWSLGAAPFGSRIITSLRDAIVELDGTFPLRAAHLERPATRLVGDGERIYLEIE